MSMRFPYRMTRTSQPALALGGTWFRPQPIIDVSVVGPSDTRIVAGKLDTAADDTVFPERLAAQIGVDLTNAPTGIFRGATPGAVAVRYARVTMRLARNGERREWSALVGFAPAPFARALLGFAGFLQFFGACFYGDREEVELTVNGLYPGT
jgi:hypothetical protein